MAAMEPTLQNKSRSARREKESKTSENKRESPLILLGGLKPVFLLIWIRILVYKRWVLAPDQGEQTLCIFPLSDQRLYTMTRLDFGMERNGDFWILEEEGRRKKMTRCEGGSIFALDLHQAFPFSRSSLYLPLSLLETGVAVL